MFKRTQFLYRARIMLVSLGTQAVHDPKSESLFPHAACVPAGGSHPRRRSGPEAGGQPAGKTARKRNYPLHGRIIRTIVRAT